MRKIILLLMIPFCCLLSSCKENVSDTEEIELKNTLAGTKWRYHTNMTIEEVDLYCSVNYTLWFGSSSVSLTYDMTIVPSGSPVGRPTTTNYNYTVFDDQIIFTSQGSGNDLVGYQNGDIITLYNASTNEKIGNFRKDN